MSFKQDGRLFSLNTPLGKDVLLLKDITGEEGISRLYSFHLNLLSENHSISFKDIIGKNVTISIALADGTNKVFQRHCIRVFPVTRSRPGQGGDPFILLHCDRSPVAVAVDEDNRLPDIPEHDRARNRREGICR